MSVEAGNDAPISEPAVTQLVPGPNTIDITPDKDGGVLKEIIKEGTGEDGPCEGEQVYVHYVGKLTDGTKFDSSRDRGEKFDFVLGKGRVIKAWDLGVATMKRGEVANLFCRGDYAYGEAGSPPKIPPNATLVFEVELFDWKMEDLSKAKDGGIQRRTIKKGEGFSTPNEGALVNVHILGRHNGVQFDDRSIQFNLGEGQEINIPEGIETALERFKKGEKSLLHLKPAYAFGVSPKPEFNLPANADVEYEVELKSFEKAKENWEFDADEKLEQSKIFKDKGTQYFKEGRYLAASKQYQKVISFLEYEKNATVSYYGWGPWYRDRQYHALKDEKAKEKDQLLLAAHLNVTMCALKLENYMEARDSAAKALEMERFNEKGLFRRGQAYLALAEPELALRDFEDILAKDPNNKAALNQVNICKAKIRESAQREKQLYSNIFKKMAEQDKNACGNNAWSCGWWDDRGKGVQLEVDLEKVEREKKAELDAQKAARREEIRAQQKRGLEMKQAREEAKRLEEEKKRFEALALENGEAPIDGVETMPDSAAERIPVDAGQTEECGTTDPKAEPVVCNGLAEETVAADCDDVQAPDSQAV